MNAYGISPIARWTRAYFVVPCVGISTLFHGDLPAQQSDTVVKVAGAPKHPGVAGLASEMSVGGANATADEYIFTSVAELLPLRDGSIIVVDRGSGTSVFVRHYDSSGKYVRTLGRYGEGPGEYVSPNGLGELPDGRIIVRDSRGGRVSVYPATGSGQGTQLIGSTIAGSAMGPGYLLVTTDGTIHTGMLLLPGRGPAPPEGSFTRFRSNGMLMDTLFSPQLPEIGPALLSASSADGRSGTSNAIPFAPAWLKSYSPLGYFVTARTDRYSLDLLIPPRGSSGWKPGDPVTSIRHTSTPVPVDDAERAERRKRIEDSMRGMSPGWQWTGPDIPRVKPPLNELRFGLDGRLWVGLATPSERVTLRPDAPPAGPGGGGSAGAGGGSAGAAAPPPRPTTAVIAWRQAVRYDVFDPDGTYQGAVAVPSGTTVTAMRGEYAWGIVRDADGVQSVHRFRIAWKQ